MFANTPEEVMESFDEAFNRGDVDAIVELYDEGALVVAGPGQEVRGKTAIRALYEQIATAGASAKQAVTKVFQADNSALLLSRWTLTQSGQATQTFVSTAVLRRHETLGWKVLIDNPRGPQVLDANA